MPKLRHLFLTMIFLGLIVAEAVPVLTKLSSPAQSERQLTAEEQNTILSILQKPEDSSSSTFTGKFLDITWPLDPNQIKKDAIMSSTMMGSPQPNQTTSPAETPDDSLVGILPPINSDLYYAYQDGGRFWYGQGSNILVIFPNESIHSFNKATGAETMWMQDRLAYPPISDSMAYTNYQQNYRALIVAETTQWVLMEFPSGGIVKVYKPQYTASGGSGIVSSLPNFLLNLVD